MTEQRDDPTYHPPPPASPDVRQKRSVGAVAHLASVIVAVALVPIAYLLLDFAMREMRPRVFGALDESALPPKVWVSVCAASGLMVIAAGIGRLSGLGPLVAGLLWGALPTVVTLIHPAVDSKAARRPARHLRLHRLFSSPNPDYSSIPSPAPCS